VGRLLKEMLATVGRDVLQPARVSPKMERRILDEFLRPFSRLPSVLPFLTFLHSA
jgi:hypothetical protein